MASARPPRRSCVRLWPARTSVERLWSAPSTAAAVHSQAPCDDDDLSLGFRHSSESTVTTSVRENTPPPSAADGAAARVRARASLHSSGDDLDAAVVCNDSEILRSQNIQQYRAEAEKTEAAVSCDADYALLVEYVRGLEEDAKLAREENAKLLEVQRVLREENSGLRGLVKKAMAGAMPTSTETAALAPVAVTSVVKSPSMETPGVMVPVKPKEKGTDAIELNEGKITPKLGAGECYNGELWYLDTSGSNHMSGNEKMFSKLDTSVKGTVRFGDRSVVEVHGRGSVLFSCHTGKQHVLKNVYFIPKLRSNIVSLGQLDEEGCKSVLHRGLLSVFDHSGELLARAQRTRNRLYAWNLKKLACVLPGAKKLQVPTGERGVMHGAGAQPPTRARSSASKVTMAAREVKSGAAARGIAGVKPA